MKRRLTNTDQSFILVFLDPPKKLYKLTREGKVFEQRRVRRWRTFGPHRRRDLVPEYVDRIVTLAPARAASAGAGVRESRLEVKSA